MLGYFTQEMNQTFTLYPYKSGIDDNGNPEEGISSTASITGQVCGYFTGAQAEKFVADRYKTDLTGVIISEVVSVPDGSRIVMNGTNYIVINADDIALQGEVLAIAVRTE
jgi:hypothetical protein